MGYLTVEERRALEADSQEASWKPSRVDRETLLDEVETSVHPTIRAQLREIEAKAAKSADRFRTEGHHARKAEFLDTLSSCSQTYAVWEVDGLPAVHPMRCRIRACPICAEISTRRWYTRLKAEAGSMTALKHITLTLRHNDRPLPEQITRLISAFHNLRRQLFWKHRTPWGYYALEIKRNKANTLWHPHLHVLANTAFIPVDVLAEAWKLATKDSYQVKIRAVNSDRAKYIAKYQSKGSDLFGYGLDPYEIAGQIKGRRFFQRFGTWPMIQKPDAPVIRFLGSVHSILTRWAHGDLAASHIGSWLWQQHPECIYQAVKHPPPRRRW